MAVKWYRKAAKQGFSDAQYNLANMYYNGKGVEKNYQTAVKWYKKAAEQGDADAQTNLGYMYQNGEGVEKSYATAVKWYTKAAKQGRSDAQYNLANMYYNGKGVEKNYQTAVKWFKKAVQETTSGPFTKSNTYAQSKLGYMYYNGIGVEKNYQTAAKWYTKAANDSSFSFSKGDAYAQAKLAYMYNNGQGVKKNYQTAIKWYTKAAEQGNSIAQYNLGHMYNTGQGVNKNDHTAIKWYRKAAKQGFSSAQSNLGVMYQKGEGVKKNYILAYAWYNEAAANGDEQATKNLQIIEKKMTAEQIAVAQMINPLEMHKSDRLKENNKPKKESVFGTAFMINAYHLITNHHVIKDCQSLRVANANYQSPVSVIKSDERNDLALLKASKPNMNHLVLFAEYNAKQGQKVIVMGYPYGKILGSEVKLSTENISALSGIGNDASMYQITAPIQPGNSGGPLMNDEGQVIGIVTARLSKKLDSENVNFAIKSNVARLFLDGNNTSYQVDDSSSWMTPGTEKIAKKSKGAIVQVICKQ